MKKIAVLFFISKVSLSFAGLSEDRVAAEFKKSERVTYYQVELEKHFGRKMSVDVDWKGLGSFCKAKNFVCEVNFFENRLDDLKGALMSIAKDDIGKKALSKVSKIKLKSGKTQKASISGDTLVWEEDFMNVVASSNDDKSIANCANSSRPNRPI